jgi:hypothetical protein
MNLTIIGYAPRLKHGMPVTVTLSGGIRPAEASKR